MKRIFFPALLLVFLTYGCSKKVHPTRGGDVVIYNGKVMESPHNSSAEASTPPGGNSASAPAPTESKAVFPKTIYVNDAAAKKSVDGRLYYDVKGHRYWKNYKDGKYYLFNKSMYSNPDFQPPKDEG